MDQLTYQELAQLRDVLIIMSNTNSCCAMNADDFVYTNIGWLREEQFEDVGLGLELFWGRVVCLLFDCMFGCFSKFHQV